MRGLAEAPARWAIPWPCIFEFFSVVTNARIWKAAASSPSQAWRQIEAWMGSPSLVLLSEPEAFSSIVQPIMTCARVRGPVVHDARIAALCVAYGVERLLSRDRDFSLFPELVVEDPL